MVLRLKSCRRFDIDTTDEKDCEEFLLIMKI